MFTPALLRSREQWSDLGTAYGQHPLLPVGAQSLGPRGHPDLESTLRSITEFELPHEIPEAAELRHRYPQFAIEDDDIGVLDTLGGVIRPELAVVAATEQELIRGATAHYDTTVTVLEPHRDGVRVVSTSGDLWARRAVLTTGPRTTRLVPELANVHAFGIPTLDGYSIKATPDIDFPLVDDWAQRPTTLTRDQLRAAGQEMQRMLPDLIPEASRWSVHAESFTPGKMPIIDTLAEGRIVIATALSGNGFKFAPVWGATLAELATTGESAFTEDMFTLAAHRAHAKSS